MSELSRMPAMNFCAADGRRFERSEPIHDLRSCRRVPNRMLSKFLPRSVSRIGGMVSPRLQVGLRFQIQSVAFR
jgi:hypothetical protein